MAIALDEVYCPVTRHPLWMAGKLTKLGYEVYTAGDCWLLAWELADELGVTKTNLWTLGGRMRWCHVVVEVGEDLFLDADGLSTSEQLEEKWGKRLVLVDEPEAVASFSAYKRWLGAEQEFKPEAFEARSVARLLIGKHMAPALAA